MMNDTLLYFCKRNRMIPVRKYISNYIPRYMKYGQYCISIGLIWIVWSLSENTALMI